MGGFNPFCLFAPSFSNCGNCFFLQIKGQAAKQGFNFCWNKMVLHLSSNRKKHLLTFITRNNAKEPLYLINLAMRCSDFRSQNAYLIWFSSIWFKNLLVLQVSLKAKTTTRTATSITTPAKAKIITTTTKAATTTTQFARRRIKCLKYRVGSAEKWSNSSSALLQPQRDLHVFWNNNSWRSSSGPRRAPTPGVAHDGHDGQVAHGPAVLGAQATA